MKENESICIECDKKINDDTETRWNEHGEPVCAKCFKDKDTLNDETMKELTGETDEEYSERVKNKSKKA